MQEKWLLKDEENENPFDGVDRAEFLELIAKGKKVTFNLTQNEMCACIFNGERSVIHKCGISILTKLMSHINMCSITWGCSYRGCIMF